MPHTDKNMNMVNQVVSQPMSTQRKQIANDYTPDGRKLSSRHVAFIPNGKGSYRLVASTDLYVDGLVVRGGKPLMWLFDGGYVSLDDNGGTTSWNYYVADHLGSTRMVVGSDNTVKETISYYPFGSEMRMEDPAQMNSDFLQPYRFTGKELDRVNGLNMYDFGARWYDVAGVPVWTSIDPLAEKYYHISPYAYCGGNPVNLIDLEGLFPTGIITIHKERSCMATCPSITGVTMTTYTQLTYYNFTKSAAHLLSLVSCVSEKYIRNVRLEEYGWQRENNCITLGSTPENTRMLVSPTYFDESNKSSEQYNDWWFREFSHEAGHIKQIERDQNNGIYLLKTIYGYFKTMSHDEAPREIEAERGSEEYESFRDFVKKVFKTDLNSLFIGKESEESKITQLDVWWNSYKKTR